MTSIILTNDHGLNALKASVQSIREYADTPYEIIIVDRGSRDGSLRYWIRQPKIKLISFPDRRGVSAACRIGVKLAAGEAMLLMESGMRLTPGALSRMLRCLYSSEDIGVVQPMLTDRPDEEERTEGKNGPAGSRWQETERIGGLCCLFRQEAADRFGPADEFGDRVRKAGYRIMTAGDAFLYSEGGGLQEVARVSEAAGSELVP